MVLLQSQDLESWTTRDVAMDTRYLGNTEINNLDYLVVVQVQLQCLQGGDLCWDRFDGVVGKVQQVQLGKAAEHKREA